MRTPLTWIPKCSSYRELEFEVSRFPREGNGSAVSATLHDSYTFKE